MPTDSSANTSSNPSTNVRSNVSPTASTSAEDTSAEALTEAPRPLRESAHEAISYFLAEIDTPAGQPYTEIYDMVMSQVEEPLLRAVMTFTQGNQSRASEMLGLNRGTLRKKLYRYGIHEPSPNRKTIRN